MAEVAESMILGELEHHSLLPQVLLHIRLHILLLRHNHHHTLIKSGVWRKVLSQSRTTMIMTSVT